MAENDRQKMMLDLLEAMGSSLDSPPSLSDSLALQPETRSLESALSLAKEKRGELLAARQRARAANADLDSKTGALRPQIYGFAMGDAFNPRDDMGNRSGYTAGVVASFPLFDSGMRRSEISSSRAAYEKAKAEETAWSLRTQKEVRQAYLDVETAAKNYGTATAAREAAQAAYEVVKVRVEAGKGILVEQLDALASLTRARANVAKSIFEHFVAKAKLTRAMGETGVGK
jgi:outer membrane protein TolC